ncbi:MAG: molybdenum cofactor biosynthesis protein MoaE [Leptospiraceae bacterium]|nr:molybdenum cofactor biosynthesis protein MoaE [Leptospiraceae bacterium]
MHIENQTLAYPPPMPNLAEMGGYVLFAGIVRNINEGQKVTGLRYEAYEQMAHDMIAQIIEASIAKWNLLYADCKHRLGFLEVGEVAVWVATGSIHRGEAYDANRYIIDRVKHEVPIWKQEFFQDGSSHWSKGCKHSPISTQ